MELLTKIFETLDIGQLALLQMVVVVVLALILSATLIKPILSTFEERERLSVTPLDEARALVAEAEEKAKRYEEEIRRAAAAALAAKRRTMDEVTRSERHRIEEVVEASNREVEEIRHRIAGEAQEAGRALRAEIARLSAEIAGKVLGRQVA